MYQPASYGDQDSTKAYWHLVNGVTLWDVGTERQVEITGADAFAFANSLTPRNVAGCKVGRCCYTLITSEEGGIVNDPVMFRLADNHFWFSTSDSDLLLWVKGVAVNSNFDVTVCEPDVSPVQIQGPKSPMVIEALFGGRVILTRYQFVETELDGIPIVVSRTGWSGETGYEIFLRDCSYGDALWDRVLAAGRPYQIAVTGPSDANRVEAGILAYRSDMDLGTNPFELGLDRFVDLDAPGDFIGKKALLKVRAAGIARKMVGIRLLGDPLATPFDERWPVTVDGVRTGDVTVAVFSPRLQMNIGYAMVRIGDSALGTRLSVAAPFGFITAVVTEMPFIKRQ
jgi:aminomethyltransferase